MQGRQRFQCVKLPGAGHGAALDRPDPQRAASDLTEAVENARILGGAQHRLQVIDVRGMRFLGRAQLVLQRAGVEAIDGGNRLDAAGVLTGGVIQSQIEGEDLELCSVQR